MVLLKWQQRSLPSCLPINIPLFRPGRSPRKTKKNNFPSLRLACNLPARNPFAPPPPLRRGWLQPEKQAENVGRKLKPDGRSQDALKHAKSCKLRSFEHPPPRVPPPPSYIGFLHVLPIPSCVFLSLSSSFFIVVCLVFSDGLKFNTVLTNLSQIK